jgi:hypothetical protein
MLETNYAWRDSARFRVSADVAAEELGKCTDETGFIVPQLVIDRAREVDLSYVANPFST